MVALETRMFKRLAIMFGHGRLAIRELATMFALTIALIFVLAGLVICRVAKRCSLAFFADSLDVNESLSVMKGAQRIFP